MSSIEALTSETSSVQTARSDRHDAQTQRHTDSPSLRAVGDDIRPSPPSPTPPPCARATTLTSASKQRALRDTLVMRIVLPSSLLLIVITFIKLSVEGR